MDFPCYCCGRNTKGTTAHYVVTVDGCRFMSHAQWVALCEQAGFDHANPKTAIADAGVTWRPEAYGSTCYKRTKANTRPKACAVEVISPDGSKYLFVG